MNARKIAAAPAPSRWRGYPENPDVAAANDNAHPLGRAVHFVLSLAAVVGFVGAFLLVLGRLW